MPILQDRRPIEYLSHLAESNVCEECGGPLSVCWGGKYGKYEYMVICVRNRGHNGIMRPFKLTPYNQPGYNLINFKRRTNELVMTIGPEKAKQLQPYQQAANLNQKQVTEIVDTIWPGAPPVEKKKAIMLCVKYQLNPLLKHIFLIKFGTEWVMVLGIKATRLMAKQETPFSYLDDTPRAMTSQEGLKILGEGYHPDEFIYFITKLKSLTTGALAQGIGKWPKAVQPYGTDKGNSRENMSATRSERQAFDRLCPGAIPRDVEVMDEAFVNADKPSEPSYPVVEVVEPVTETEKAQGLTADMKIQQAVDSGIDLDWLKESMAKLKWTNRTCLVYLNEHYKVTGDSLTEALGKLNKADAEHFCATINERIEML